MRTAVFLLLMVIVSSIYSQNSDFKVSELTKQLDYELQIIDSFTFFNATSQLIEENQIEIKNLKESDFVKQYPQIFIKEEKCYNINGIDGKIFHVCEYDSTEDLIDRSQYKFNGQYCDFALIYVSGWESWGFISVNLIDGIGFYTLGTPITTDCKIIFSHSNYYGEEELSFTNIETKKQLVLGIDYWTTDEVRQIDKKYYLKLKTIHRLENEIKFIMIEIK